MNNEDENLVDPVDQDKTGPPAGADEYGEDGMPRENDVIPIAEDVKHLKTKTIPAIVMLLGGLTTAIMCFYYHMDVNSFLLRVLGALLLFWIIGGIVKTVLDKIVIKESKGATDEVLEDAEHRENADAEQETAENSKG